MYATVEVCLISIYLEVILAGGGFEPTVSGLEVIRSAANQDGCVLPQPLSSNTGTYPGRRPSSGRRPCQGRPSLLFRQPARSRSPAGRPPRDAGQRARSAPG